MIMIYYISVLHLFGWQLVLIDIFVIIEIR